MVVARGADAQSNTVSVSVPSTSTFRITTATAGQPPVAVSQSVGTYTMQTVSSTRRLRARLAVAAPPGVTIEILVESPGGTTNNGWVALTTTYKVLADNFPPGNTYTHAITYRVTATSAAGVLAAQSISITLQNNLS